MEPRLTSHLRVVHADGAASSAEGAYLTGLIVGIGWIVFCLLGSFGEVSSGIGVVFSGIAVACYATMLYRSARVKRAVIGWCVLFIILSVSQPIWTILITRMLRTTVGALFTHPELEFTILLAVTSIFYTCFGLLGMRSPLALIILLGGGASVVTLELAGFGHANNGPIMLAIAVLHASILASLLIWRHQRTRALSTHCLCGYNLTGITTGICPECGAAFSWSSTELPISRS